jgi:hypothetical protein
VNAAPERISSLLTTTSAVSAIVESSSLPWASVTIRNRISVTIRNRIKELREVKAGDLIHNPKNWRRHPKSQAEALRGLLGEVGYADALLVRELPDGRLMLIDGHLRVDRFRSRLTVRIHLAPAASLQFSGFSF